MHAANIPRHLAIGSAVALTVLLGAGRIATQAPSSAQKLPLDSAGESAAVEGNIPNVPDPDMAMFIAGLEQVVNLSLDNSLPTQTCFPLLLEQVPEDLRAEVYKRAFGDRIERELSITDIFPDPELFAGRLRELGLGDEAARFLKIVRQRQALDPQPALR